MFSDDSVISHFKKQITYFKKMNSCFDFFSQNRKIIFSKKELFNTVMLCDYS